MLRRKVDPYRRYSLIVVEIVDGHVETHLSDARIGRIHSKTAEQQ